MTTAFGSRLQTAFQEYGRLCVGIDPHSYLLDLWGLGDSAGGAREFGLRVVDAAAGAAGIVKPQIAFFERFGSAGYAALEEVLAAARAAELLVIGDVKRGEIGSSMAAYAEAWLTPGGPLEVDAITVNPYLGVGALTETFALAEQHGKGIFVLAATSNPEAARLQQSRMAADGTSVARSVVDDVAAWNSAKAVGDTGSIGVVIGATLELSAFDLDLETEKVLPVLAPGFGHQGADAHNASEIYGKLAGGVVASESRSVLGAGPGDIKQAIVRRAEEMRESFA